MKVHLTQTRHCATLRPAEPPTPISSPSRIGSQRAMLPMPKAYAAKVIDDDATDEEDGGERPAKSLAVAAAPIDTALLAAAGSGTLAGSYTSGMQDGMDRVNRFTSQSTAAAHRAMAVAPSDWFNPGMAAPPAAKPTVPGPALKGEPSV